LYITVDSNQNRSNSTMTPTKCYLSITPERSYL
jgi:hypothetical protein